MKTQLAIQKMTKYVLVAALVLAGAFVVIGCTTTSDEPAEEVRNEENAVNEEKVTGTITSISEEEIMIDADSDSNDFLKGSVRVNISLIDREIVDNLKVGDKVEIQYPGKVGMSEPPFISADTLEVK